ncbi:MAG: enoyl-CoA hydratase/isomerase family protein [Desulfurococcales archaeon]|jgi:enoyl-CoA hydratase/carnithine racemase|nr:enoyl-CoA hydratase/isomerase family protein [Desulfurococcales archaeon]
MSQKYETVILERGEITKIILNRPEKLNALNSQLRRELVSAINEVKNDPKVKVVIFAGAGKSFCAGQDINESVQFRAEDAIKWIEENEILYEAIRSIDVPTIARIHGYAVGAGFQIAMLPDIKIAAEDAKLGLPEINVGIPAILGSQILLMLGMPLSKVAEIIMLGSDRFITGKEAEMYGLVNKAVPIDELDKTVEDIAKKLASMPRTALKLNKMWLRELTSSMLREAYKYGKIAHTIAFASGEPQKAMTDFLEKRKKK